MDENRLSNELKQGHQIEEFPIDQTQRSCTDVFCAVVGIFYTLSLVFTAFIVFNNDHYMRTSFPSDSQGRVCGYDLKNHPYIYFTRFPSIKERVCVQNCPKVGDGKLNCVPTDDIGCAFNNNPNFTVTFMESTPEELGIGSFCVPNEPTLKEKLYQDIDVTNRYNFFQQIKSIAICGLVSLGLAILYLCMVQWRPKLMNFLTIILGLLFVGIMALFAIFYPSGSISIRIIFAVVVVLLMAIVGYGAFKSKACFDMHGVFLSAATHLLKENMRMLLFIPLFLAIFILFVMIVVWQLKSLWSSSGIFFTPEAVYYQFQPGSTTFLTFVTFLQFLWGLSFIKESFNFCVSGNAVQWYQDEKQVSSWAILTPLKYLVKYHFGSVVAASFINVVFSLFDYIFDVLRADTNNEAPRHSLLSAMDSLFDLVRSDSLAYINLSGNPYCNSSRYCQALCRRSPIAEYSQSISRSYRICSHFFLAGLVATLSFFLQATASVFIVMVVFVISLFVSTFFISLHADAAQAIQIVFLLDLELARQKQKDTSKHGIPHLPLRNKKIANEYQKESQQLKTKVGGEK